MTNGSPNPRSGKPGGGGRRGGKPGGGEHAPKPSPLGPGKTPREPAVEDGGDRRGTAPKKAR